LGVTFILLPFSESHKLKAINNNNKYKKMDIKYINRFEEIIKERLSIKTNFGRNQLMQIIKDSKLQLFEEMIKNNAPTKNV